MKVKKIVWERDGHACIYCGKYVDVYYANSHYIKRSHLGKGIEQNVVCACPTCHYKYDFKDFDGEMKNYTREYLSRLYDGWNEDDLVYRK
jgi:5-methylcytosine-specific restriction endonuclease McrA